MSLLEQLKNGVESQSPEQTQAFAEALAQELPENTVLALHGDLGAGKSTFVKGLARGLGITKPITSPSYNLFFEYSGRWQLIHMDAYRMEAPEQWEALMLEDFLRPPFCLAIEWPEKLGDYLPEGALHLHFSITAEHHHRIELAS